MEEDFRLLPAGSLRLPRRGGAREPLAIKLRADSAGSNTVADHIETTWLALAHLLRRLRRRVMVRTDSADGT